MSNSHILVLKMDNFEGVFTSVIILKMYVILFIVKIRATGKVHCNSGRTGEFDT